MGSTQTVAREVETSSQPSHGLSTPDSVDGFTEDVGDEVRRHPLGIKPSGNALTSSHDLREGMGLFGSLPDELVLTFLEWLDKASLWRIGTTCRALFAYSSHDQLWRDLYLRNARSDTSWRGSWRATVLKLQSGALTKVDCRYLFSDALHRPFFCSQIPLTLYTRGIPKANRIPRLADLSPSQFEQSWTNRPFILTEPVKEWPVYSKWSAAAMLAEFGSSVFRAEAVDWSLDTYVNYMNENSDESPLYLFDRDFVRKMNLHSGRAGSYWPPECFGGDLFNLLGDQRPDHQWLIIGPERSGSTFHKDPNATSAWNAVVRGSKYWIMFPSAFAPPGVYVSDDQSEVTSPLSIAEWLLTFHEEARKTPGCLEGVCGEGEVLHVPSGWWHLVVNLDPAIAITQNFVPRSHLRNAIRFLRDKPAQVTGFKDDVKDPHALFLARLKAHDPELLATVDKIDSRKRKWNDVVRDSAKNEEDERKGFSFSFGSDLEYEG